MLDISSSLSTIVPGIIIWDQYVDFLKWFLNSIANVVHNGGVAIIIFTIIVKTLMLPLTIKSIRSSKMMQELQPKLKEIQKKHGNDRAAASQAQMALYQQYGINPMAGCLPMLIQLPIFFGVYRAIIGLVNSDTGHWVDSFLWMKNLSAADPWHILPILAGIFQFVQARMMRPANQQVTDPQQKMMNTMMNFMPLSVVIFGWGFAAGAVLYWVAQAIYSVVQQWLITGWGAFGQWFPWLPELPEHRRLGYAPARNLDVVVESGEPVKKGRFATFMEKQAELARQKQEEAQAKRDEMAAAQKVNKPTSAQGPRQSAKRSDYQSRVDAATKYSKKSNDDVIDVEAKPATRPTANRKRKKKA